MPRKLPLCLVALATPFALAEFEPSKPISKVNLIVNGGYSETSYHERHRRTVKFFYDTVFKRRGTVLDGGGPDGLYVPDDGAGNYFRDEAGWVKLSRSKYDFPTTPATFGNVSETFTDLSTMGVTHVSTVYGDHGGTDGVALWGANDDLSATDSKTLADKFPAETIVQSLHLHCYSGASMVNPKRSHPQKVSDWPAFLKANYRPNSCGLGLGQFDEVTYGVDWNKGDWKNLLSKKVSLAEFKKLMGENLDLWTTPMLTSDYLTDDLVRFFCRRAQAEESNSPGVPRGRTVSTHGGGTVTNSYAPAATLEDQVCRRNEHRDAVHAVVEEFKALDKVSDEIETEIRRHRREYVAANYPAPWAQYKEAQAKIETLHKDLILRESQGKGTLADRKQVEAEIAKLRETAMVPISRVLLTLEDSATLRNYITSRGASSLFTRRDQLRPRYYDAQKKRKQLEAVWEERKRKFIDSEIKSSIAPEMLEVHKTYDSIKKCENTPFN